MRRRSPPVTELVQSSPRRRSNHERSRRWSAEFLSRPGPTAAILRVEDAENPATRLLPRTFKSAPSEWYKWTNDLRTNSNIKILFSIDPASFPLGTGPKPHEIWHEGYYPVVWTNTRYRMIYFNMGHNDIDYEAPGHAKSVLPMCSAAGWPIGFAARLACYRPGLRTRTTGRPASRS